MIAHVLIWQGYGDMTVMPANTASNLHAIFLKIKRMTEGWDIDEEIEWANQALGKTRDLKVARSIINILVRPHVGTHEQLERFDFKEMTL